MGDCPPPCKQRIFLSGFIEGVTDFFTGIGDVITQAFDALPKFDLLGFKNQSEGILKQTENTVQKLNQDFFFAQDKFNKEVDKRAKESWRDSNVSWKSCTRNKSRKGFRSTTP